MLVLHDDAIAQHPFTSFFQSRNRVLPSTRTREPCWALPTAVTALRQFPELRQGRGLLLPQPLPAPAAGPGLQPPGMGAGLSLLHGAPWLWPWSRLWPWFSPVEKWGGGCSRRILCWSPLSTSVRQEPVLLN